MTLPTHDAQPSRSIPRRPQMVSPTHSISIPPSQRPDAPFSSLSSPLESAPEQDDKQLHGHALDFATHSWDLATGGLKTLTAKREFPPRPDRRQPEKSSNAHATSSSNYLLILIILVCVVLMLAGGGVVLLVMLQL